MERAAKGLIIVTKKSDKLTISFVLPQEILHDLRESKKKKKTTLKIMRAKTTYRTTHKPNKNFKTSLIYPVGPSMPAFSLLIYQHLASVFSRNATIASHFANSTNSRSMFRVIWETFSR